MSKELPEGLRAAAIEPDWSYTGAVARARAQLDALATDAAEPSFVLLWREADGMCCSTGQADAFLHVRDFAVQSLHSLYEAAAKTDRAATAAAAAVAMKLLGTTVYGVTGGVSVSRDAP